MRDRHAVVGALTLAQYDLELHEITEPRDPVQVHARATDLQQIALLDHAAPEAERARERGAQRVGVGHRRDCVVGGFWAGGVRPLVRDQLAAAVGEHAQLEAADGATKERVVLRDRLRRAIGAGDREWQQRLDAVDAGLDFDVACHAVLGG